MNIKPYYYILKFTLETSFFLNKKKQINELDSDDTGTIDFPEFLTMLARRFKKAFSLKELEGIFLESSKDINGTISLKELKRVIKNMDIVLDEDELENRVNKNEILIN